MAAKFKIYRSDTVNVKIFQPVMMAGINGITPVTAFLNVF